MKKMLLILLVLIPGLGFSQDMPIQLNVERFRTGNNSCILYIHVNIDEGWHAFAFSDTALGIEPLTLLLENQNILFPTKMENENNCKTLLLKDPLFNGKSFRVYTKNLLIGTTIDITDKIPFITITLKGFASDNKKIVPIEITKEVKIGI